ncbi:hypothetical protein PVK06_012094 [Gossypium arboreum]|uniref:Uncharacterized protein n=1 Tax=Gossypium arboreum TaxID=29729 RepID=A0ABR0QAU1_GOSAR|nr:hypothetical protein PVK06_012094 [Gossypium arboreum]
MAASLIHFDDKHTFTAQLLIVRPKFKMFWSVSSIIWESVRFLKFVATRKRLDSHMRLACMGATNSICNQSRHWWKDRGLEHTLFTFHVASVQSHSKA